jgi:hypothetical protein
MTIVGGLCREGWCLLVPTLQMLFIAHFEAPVVEGRSCIDKAVWMIV